MKMPSKKRYKSQEDKLREKVKQKQSKPTYEEKPKIDKSKYQKVDEELRKSVEIREESEQKEQKPKISFGVLFIVSMIIITGVVLHFYNGQSIDVIYSKNALPIYHQGYDTCTNNMKLYSNISALYWNQFTYIEKYGGGSTNKTHYINNIDTTKSINDNESKLIYAAGYINCYMDTMVGSNNAKINNIPK